MHCIFVDNFGTQKYRGGVKTNKLIITEIEGKIYQSTKKKLYTNDDTCCMGRFIFLNLILNSYNCR